MSKRSVIDPALLDFCTPRQKVLLQALIKHGSERKAAEATGVSRSAINQAVTRVKHQASMRGYAPEFDMTRTSPLTHPLKGTSTLYGRDGELLLQWVKTHADSEQIAIVAQEMAKAFFEAKKPLRPVKPPKYTDDMLLSMYVVSDLHLGLYAWARESGADYDCDIASRLLIGAMQRLMSRTPPSKYAVIAQLGDLLHLDDDSNQTRRSHNTLDVDTRYQRVSEVGLTLYRATIDMALEKHEHVHVINVCGNHDDISAYWLGVAVETAYENEPRLTVDNSPGPYYYNRFGRNLFGYTHGHEAKMPDLPEIMAADRPEEFGQTEFRYWATGHVHHEQLKEFRTCRVESFRTLAGKDSWHNRRGYRSGRDMRAIVFHHDFGEDERFRVGVRELEQ